MRLSSLHLSFPLGWNRQPLPPKSNYFSQFLSSSLPIFLPLSLSFSSPITPSPPRSGGARAEAGGACARWAAHGGGRRHVEAAAAGLREGETAPFSSMLSHPLYFPLLPWHRQQNGDVTTSKRRNSKVREFPFNPTFL